MHTILNIGQGAEVVFEVSDLEWCEALVGKPKGKLVGEYVCIASVIALNV